MDSYCIYLKWGMGLGEDAVLVYGNIETCYNNVQWIHDFRAY